MSTQNRVPRRTISQHRPWASERWVKRQNDERRLGFYKVGGLVLVDLDELDALVEAGRVNPAPSLRAVRRPRSA
ncbi:MAG: hypothetical protein ACLQRM_17015 [Acidimicrobiales bacterium]